MVVINKVCNPGDIYMNATCWSGMTGEWVLISGMEILKIHMIPIRANLAKGENLFRWIVTNGNCSDYAEVLMVNGDVVDADAGRPQAGPCVNMPSLRLMILRVQ